jgi:putative alpha-1,2-mannosidase
MKNILIVLLIVVPSFSLIAGSNQVDFVNPFICTEGDHGHWHPSALVPFGLVKLGPDTYPGSLTGDGDWAHSGYNYADHQIRGFSHFHKGSSGGTSICDRAGFLSIFPFSTEPADTFL